MADKVKFTKEDFLRRERDILKINRMPQDMNMDINELLNQSRIPLGDNGNGEANPDMTGGQVGY